MTQMINATNDISILKASPIYASYIHQMIGNMLVSLGLYQVRPIGVDDNLDDLKNQYF